MADFERSATVMASADASFAFLADPANLAEWVPAVTHLDTTAVDGGPEGEADDEAGSDGPVTRATFLPDAGARRVSWDLAGGGYHGSATIQPGTSGTSQVTLAIHVPDDAGAGTVEGLLDRSIRNLQRLLLQRR